MVIGNFRSTDSVNEKPKPFIAPTVFSPSPTLSSTSFWELMSSLKHQAIFIKGILAFTFSLAILYFMCGDTIRHTLSV